MRPVRLELQGFSSFRDRTVIDFTGADLFVLTGPTGSGKSSILDAITFALYGKVSRYGDVRSPQAVMTQNVSETRVSLEFSVGEVPYRVVRVISRDARGNTRPPRISLEQGDRSIAALVSEVDREIPEILGLTFDQYTKCVVLPQGDFADLLHAKPGERQDILIRLLDIGIYREVRDRAANRAATAKGEVDQLTARLATLADATPEALAALQDREAAVRALAGRLEAAQAALDGLDRDREAAEREIGRQEDEVRALRAVRIPSGVAELGDAVASAREALAAADERAAQAAEAAATAQAALDVLTPRATVETLLDRHDRHDRLSQQVEQARRAAAGATEQASRATAALAVAETERDLAAGEHDALLRSDAAYHAAQGLAAGDPCPICRQPLTAAPALAAPAGLDAAARARKDAEDACRRAEQAARKAAAEDSAAAATLKTVEDQLAEVLALITGKASRQRCIDELGRIDAAEAALNAARQADTRARAALKAARDAYDEAQERQRTAADALNRARDPFAAMGAPQVDTTDLAASWRALADWAATQAAARDAAVAAARERAGALAAERARLLDAQRAACEALEVPVAAGLTPYQAAVRETGVVDQQVKALADRIAEREQVAGSRAGAESRQQVASRVATHFKRGAGGFENWFLQEALRQLCEIASVRLRELSSGAYSLTNDDTGEFLVIDHANADTRRGVRTLSGGETFLASLSLALALSEQVAQLSPGGAAHLESLFLDEGFGTLDPDTLEVVRSAIEELRSRGRLVGIVTHVRELAEYIPVQYRVRKDAGTSRVERVDA
jgi:exonuclease SbcC